MADPERMKNDPVAFVEAVGIPPVTPLQRYFLRLLQQRDRRGKSVARPAGGVTGLHRDPDFIIFDEAGDIPQSAWDALTKDKP